MKNINLLILIVFMSFHSLFGQSILPNNPQATLQGTFYGVVTNCDTGEPMQNVTVKAIGSQQFVAETDATGYYEMLVEDGVYDVEFILVGYDTISILDTTIVTGSMTEISDYMCEFPYPVSNLTAILNESGTECYVSWDLPRGPYEIIYEDGEADDYTIWSQSGGAVAVQFTPVGYPATAIGGRIYVGDGSFPAGGNFLGSEMAIGVIDDDGADGLPGTILDSIIITVDNYGWVEYYGIFDVTFEEGDFYMVMWQLGDNTNSAPVGVDTDAPTVYQSYNKLPGTNTWSLSPYQDIMIRAYVDGPNPGVVSKNGNKRDLLYYSLARVSDFDPCTGPQTGTLTPIANPTVEYYNDLMMWGWGFHAYAVLAIYQSSTSVWAYSNVVASGNKSVAFNVDLCNGNSADSVVINMVNYDTCISATYQLVTNSVGFAVHDHVMNGTYDIDFDYNGNVIFEMDSVFIHSDTTFDIEMTQIQYPARNMYVDSATNIATWDKPTDTVSHAEVLSYNVYLNDNLVAQTDTNDLSYFFDSLVYGESYNTCVAAVYECGLSEQDCFSWVSNILKPPANFQHDYVYNVDEVILKWNPPTNFSSPDGLASFNIYQDGISIGSIPYEGQGADDWIYHTVESLAPAIYIFNASAVYDLSVYGFPGEFYESTWVADTVEIIWGLPLPFYEDWDENSFSYNGWTISDSIFGWKINSSIGNPYPSAEFSNDSKLRTNYTSTLLSSPMFTGGLTYGYVVLNFDIKLIDKNGTADEKIIVEIFDGTTWFEIAEFSNTGSFDFSENQIDISDLVTKDYFRVGFKAMGENTTDIESWFIDNISVIRECQAPSELTGEGFSNDPDSLSIKICWEAPTDFGAIAEWVGWGSGENFTAVSAANNFSAAIRWDAGQLAQYDGTSITKIRYYPYEGFTFLELKIWTGANAEVLIYEKDVTLTSVPREWNEVIIDDPIPLDVNDELWVGYEMEFDVGTSPAGVDAGPAKVGYGDMFTFDGFIWSELSYFGLDYNWNIEMYVQEPLSLKSNDFGKGGRLVEQKLTNNQISTSTVNANRAGSRSLKNFNIYRKEEGAEYQIYDIVDYVFPQTSYCYNDSVPNVNFQNGYYYKVTANWGSDNDNCESNPAMSLENPTEDFVYVFLDDIMEITLDDLVNIYPNPAKDYISVKSTLPMNHISVTNYVGQVIYSKTINEAMSTQLNTSYYKLGVYIMKIKTSGGVVTKKIMIVR